MIVCSKGGASLEAVIQDCRLFYRYEPAHKADAPVLLLLHGWGCDSSIFHVFEEGFLQCASLLTVDFPGHGQSQEPPVPWSVTEYSEQIFALLEQLKIEKADIIAHSFGGRVAIHLASKHPDKVGKIVLTGAAGIRKPATQNQSKRQNRYRRYKRLLGVLEKMPFLRGLAFWAQEKLRQRYGSPDYNRLNPNMRKTFVRVISQDLTELLPEIQAPALLIWGSEDTETPLWMGQKMESTIPDAGLVVFEGRSHFAFLEEPQRFQVIVRTFLWGGERA